MAEGRNGILRGRLIGYRKYSVAFGRTIKVADELIYGQGGLDEAMRFPGSFQFLDHADQGPGGYAFDRDEDAHRNQDHGG